jgi:hypothetical protein
MRKILLTLICYLFISSAYAQIQFGNRIGFGFANVLYSPAEFKPRPSLNLGFYAQKPVSTTLQLRSELNYAIKGYRYKDILSGRTETVNYQYLTLPLLVEYRATKSFLFQAGPELAWLLKHNYAKPPSAYAVEKFDIGAAIGLGWQLNNRFTIDVRYTYGLTRAYKVVIYDLTTGNISEERKLGRNQVLLLGLNTRLGK